MNDRADRPIYIETVPRRGYGLLAPVIKLNFTPLLHCPTLWQISRGNAPDLVQEMDAIVGNVGANTETRLPVAVSKTFRKALFLLRQIEVELANLDEEL